MRVIFLLWLLATLDAAFAGFRAAASRNALLDKRAYYSRSLLIGAAYGQVMVGLVGAAVIAVAHAEPSFWSIALAAATRFLWVMVPFAVLVILAFVVRLIPSIDWKCISSVVVFGPCVLIRPALMVAATVYAVEVAPKSPVLDILAIAALTVMLTAEVVLRQFMRR